MLEIVITVGLYIGAVVIMVKGAIAFCNNSHDHFVTEP